MLAVSVGVLAVAWSPALWAFLVEAGTFTDRTGHVADELALRGNPFPLLGSVTFLFPRISIDLRALFPSNVSMTNGYAGALAFPLAAVYVVRKRPRAWWIVGFVLFWFLVSLGGDGGLRTVLHHLVPATRYMRHNGMLRALFLAPLAAAAGVGASLAATTARALAARILAGWLAVVALAAALAAWLFEAELAVALRWTLPALLATALAAAALRVLPRRGAWVAAALVALAGADLAWHFQSNLFTVGDPPGKATIRSAVEALGTDFDPLAPRRTDPFFHFTKLNLVNHVPVVEGDVTLVSRAFTPLVEGRFVEVLAADRYWLSPTAWPAPPREAGVALLSRLGAGDPIPVLVGRAEEAIPGTPVVPGAFGSVRVVSYRPERVELLADVPAGEGALLASTERTAPSWRVEVDGADRPIAVVNYFFRGVRLSPGEHRVVFEYRPRPFGPLLLVSYGALAAAIAGAVLLERRRRRAPAPGEAAMGSETPGDAA